MWKGSFATASAFLWGCKLVCFSFRSVVQWLTRPQIYRVPPVVVMIKNRIANSLHWSISWARTKQSSEHTRAERELIILVSYFPLILGIVSEPLTLHLPIRFHRRSSGFGALALPSNKSTWICQKLVFMHQLCIEFCAYNAVSGIGSFVCCRKVSNGRKRKARCGVSCIHSSRNVWNSNTTWIWY